MSYTVAAERLENIATWRQSVPALHWSSPFVLPVWLRVWKQSFAPEATEYVCSVRGGQGIIGLAPLLRDGDTVRFLGGTDVCDYQDLVVVPGHEEAVCAGLLDEMATDGVRNLDLAHVRPDSIVQTVLAPLARERGCTVDINQEEVSAEMPLPDDFDAWLDTLDKKQRHEVRRKLRKLGASGTVNYRVVNNVREEPNVLETFFKMFVESREDKADFLTGPMEAYFRSLTAALSEEGIVRIGILELDSLPVAEVVCFDHSDCRYLYNSGYDPAYTAVSAGLASKVYAVKDGIERGLKKFDFLKGAEPYKQHLGGIEVPLSRCHVTFPRT